MKIEFISDVACPWCAIGLQGLEQALAALGDAIPVELSFEPFELNPDMGPEGEDTVAYLAARYGSTAQQIAQTQEAIRARGAELGFAFGERARVWNTFDAHRLLRWAGTVDPAQQRALEHALLRAYHGEGRDTSDPALLQALAAAVGLDAQRAAAILASDEFAAEVRERERFWQEAGIHSVPAVVIDRRHLISGGQPPQVFEDALRRLAGRAGG